MEKGASPGQRRGRGGTRVGTGTSRAQRVQQAAGAGTLADPERLLAVTFSGIGGVAGHQQVDEQREGSLPRRQKGGPQVRRAEKGAPHLLDEIDRFLGVRERVRVEAE